MKNLLCWTLMVWIALLGGAAEASSGSMPQQVDLYVGDTRVLDVRPLRVAVGNGKVVSATRAGEGQVVLVGAAPGQTAIHFWLPDGRRERVDVRVLANDPDAAYRNMQSLLEGVPGVQLRRADGKVIVEGQFLDGATAERVAAVVAMHPGVAVNFVGRTSWERMVRLDVRVVEFRRGALRDLGIRWRDDITGPQGGIIADFITNDRFRLPSPPGGVPDVSNTRAHSPKVYLGLSTVLDSRLRFLERQGDAWIIAEPSLSCRSGGAARFVSGGEIPIPIVNAQGATDVEFREYGIILDVKPIADASGAIYARIDTEISQIDPSQRVLDVPGLLKRRSMSEFNLRAGETLVLAGLVSRASSNERSGVPGLTHVPAAGALFSERNRRRERTELAVFITPSLAQPTPVTIPASGSSQALESLPQRAEQAWRSSSLPGETRP